MDSIALIKSQRSDQEGVSYLINGVDLIDLLDVHGGIDGALPFAEIGGDYDGSVFAADPISDCRIVLVCGCGATACGSTYVRVVREGAAVVWRDFEGYQTKAPGKGFTGLFAGFGPFYFDLAEYEAMLAEGRRVAAEYNRLDGRC